MMNINALSSMKIGEFLKASGKQDPQAPTVGDLYDFADAVIAESVSQDPDGARTANTELRAEDLEKLVKELVQEAGGESESPEMQQMHETLVAIGLTIGVFGGALNAAVKALRPDPVPAAKA